MIEIHTKTQRKTRFTYSILTRKPRQIVAAFEPGDLITFRELRCRAKFEIPIDAVFRLAVRMKVDADRRARREARAGR
jgi:hypothetical protein